MAKVFQKNFTEEVRPRQVSQAFTVSRVLGLPYLATADYEGDPAMFVRFRCDFTSRKKSTSSNGLIDLSTWMVDL